MRHEKLAGIVTAMPEESRAVLQLASGKKKCVAGGLPVYEGVLNGTPFFLVESGMGVAASSRAAEALISLANPSFLLSVGFCGAIREGAQVADLVVCGSMLSHGTTGIREIDIRDGRKTAARISSALMAAGLRAWTGSFITAEGIVRKKEISGLLSEEIKTPVLEMESSAVLAVANRSGIPFAGIRSVSDPWDEELDFSIEDFTDENMRVNISKVIGCCIRRPGIIPQLARLASNSSRAAKTLGRGVSILLPLV